jgi:hypothetical protein
MDSQDWLKAKVDYFKKYGAGARPLTLTAMATNYMSFDVGIDGRLDQFLYADPQMWCAASRRPLRYGLAAATHASGVGLLRLAVSGAGGRAQAWPHCASARPHRMPP